MLFVVPGLLAQAPKISIGHVTADPGEVLVPVHMENFANLAAMTLIIDIDTEVVSFVGIENMAFEGTWVEGYNNDRIQIEWIKPLNIPLTGEDNPADGHLLDLRLEYRGGFHTKLNFIENACEFTTATLSQIEGVEFEGGSISPNDFAGTVAMDEVGASIGGTVLMPVTIDGDGFDAVSSFSLYIEVNPTQLDYASVIPAPGVTGITASESDGVINVMWTGDPTDFNTITGPVFNIELLYKGGGLAQLRFKGNSEVTSDLSVLSVEFIDGLIFHDVPPGSAQLMIEDVFLYTEEIDNTNQNFIDVAIHAMDFATAVGSINLVIGYDGDQVDLETYAASQLSGWNVNADGSKINIAWTGTAGAEIADGELLVLTFAYSDYVHTPLTFMGGSDLQSPSLASIPVNFINGSLKVTDETFVVALTAEPEEGGEVVGAGVYPYGSFAEVDAIPNEGYAFVNWTLADGTLVSENAANTIQMFADLTLVANFELIDYTLTLIANPEEGGEVVGAGIYNFGDVISVDAIPAVGYEFVNWTDVDGAVVSTQPANEITMPSSDLTLTANFVLIDYVVTLIAKPAEGGVVTGAGTYNYGQSAVVNAVANEGYVFVNWTDEDGNEVSTSAENTLVITSDLTLIANFEKVYSVTFNVNMKYVDGFYHKLTFNAASDKVYVTGSMLGWQQPGADPDNQTMTATTADPNIYTKTLHLVAGDYMYKYFLNAGWDNGEWDGDPNRTFSVVDADVVLNDWFGSLAGDPTSIEKPDAVQLNVYPNPARSLLNIESGNQIVEVRMMDMLGQLVYVSPVNDYRMQMNVSELRNGIYFVQILTNEGSVTHRVQITK